MEAVFDAAGEFVNDALEKNRKRNYYLTFRNRLETTR